MCTVCVYSVCACTVHVQGYVCTVCVYSVYVCTIIMCITTNTLNGAAFITISQLLWYYGTCTCMYMCNSNVSLGTSFHNKNNISNDYIYNTFRTRSCICRSMKSRHN